MSHNLRTAEELERLREAGEWVQRLADPDVPGATFVAWQQWCERHPANARLFADMQEVWEGFSPPRVARIESASAAPSGWRSRPLPVAAAATIALVIGAAIWIGLGMSATREIRTVPGEIRHERLKDGSRLDLGADSEVRVDFSAQRRELRLVKGRAFFTVARDIARPFVVHAGDVSVLAVGTAFDVRSDANGTVVIVSEGRVKITPAWPGEAPMHADAGQRVRYSAPVRALTVAEVNPELTGSWRQGVLQFQEEPLREVISEVNRYSPRRIVLEDSALGEAPFTGTISRRQVDDWLLALEKILPVAVEDRGEEGLRIVRRPVPEDR